MFASDDADARAAARRLGIRVTGTLGILALTVRRELLTLTQANALLADGAIGYPGMNLPYVLPYVIDNRAHTLADVLNDLLRSDAVHALDSLL